MECPTQKLHNVSYSKNTTIEQLMNEKHVDRSNKTRFHLNSRNGRDSDTNALLGLNDPISKAAEKTRMLHARH
ncbi:hypothetical protein TNCV_2801441 [Trichonephila clavipes]|nr:hypothetical protein TNCV_2801441 [Trichonephila clavipes]